MSDIGNLTTNRRDLESSVELRYRLDHSDVDSSESSDIEQHTYSKILHKSLLRDVKKITKPRIIDQTKPLPKLSIFKQFKIFYVALQFIFKLKKRVNDNCTANLNPRIFSIVNDRASDFDYYQIYGYFKARLHSLQEYISQNKSNDSGGLLMPESFIKLCWDSTILIFTVINLVYIPFKLAFPIEQDQYFRFFECICDFFPWTLYVLEVPVTFNSAFYYQGHLHTDRKELQRHYLQGNFYKDLIVILVYDFFISRNPLEIFFPNVLVIVWFIRITRISEYLAKVEQATSVQQIYTVGWELGKLTIALVLVNHNVACAWRFLAKIEDDRGLTNNWVRSKGIQDSPWHTQYIYSFYWSIITSTTIGYGDICPVNEYEMFFVMLMVPITLVLFGYALGNIQSLFVQIKSREDNYTQKMSIVNSYIRKHNLDHKLSMKIRNYFDCFLRNLDNEDEATLLVDQLHDDLKIEVNEQVYRPVLVRSEFIKDNLDEDVQKALCQHVKYKKFLPGQRILQSGQIVQELMFIISGKVQIYIPKDNETSIKPEQNLRFIQEDQQLGEINFLLQTPIEYDVRAIDYTEVVFLRHEDFIKTLKRIPDAHEQFSLIKDNLIFNPYFKKVRKLCDICLSAHQFLDCPLAFYKPNKEHLLKKGENVKQMRKNFIRQRDKKTNSLMNRLDLIDQALMAALENNLLNETTLNEEFLIKIGINNLSVENVQQNEQFQQQHTMQDFQVPRIFIDQKPSQRVETIESDFNDFGSHRFLPDQISQRSNRPINPKTFEHQRSAQGLDVPKSKFLISRSSLDKDKNLLSLKSFQENFSRARGQRRTCLNPQIPINLQQPTKELQVIEDTLRENSFKAPTQVRRESDAQSNFDQMQIIKMEYLNMSKSESLPGFEKEYEFKYYHPNKNYSEVFGRRVWGGGAQPKVRRTILKDRIKGKHSKKISLI